MVENSEILDLLSEPFKDKALALFEEIENEGLPFRVFETTRSFKRQHELFMQGRVFLPEQKKFKKMGKTITGARPGLSPHNWGFAVDAILDVDHPYWEELDLSLPPIQPQGMWDDGRRTGKAYNRIKAAWKSYGNLVVEHGLTWGGNFTFVDMPHVEDPDWRKLMPQNWREIVIKEIGRVNAVLY